MVFGSRSTAAVGAMDCVSQGAERPHLKRAGLTGCGKDWGQENVNHEESRAREKRIKLYSCRAEEYPWRNWSVDICGETRREGIFIPFKETPASVVSLFCVIYSV